jgi:TolA-binding protein
MSEIANRGLDQNNANPKGYQPTVAHAQYMLARFAKENAKIQTGTEKTKFENDYIQALLRAKNNGHPEAMYDVAKALAKKGKMDEAADLFVKIIEKEPNGYRDEALEKTQKKVNHFVKGDSKLAKMVEEKKSHDLSSQRLGR